MTDLHRIYSIITKKLPETMTTNPVVFRILWEDLVMREEEARSQLENNTLDLLEYSENITDDMVIAIAENCPGLMKINLEECGYITDAAVIALAKNCPGLTKIYLQRCEDITNAAVIALAERCAGLTDINLVGGDYITDAAVIALAEGCAGLTRIHLPCFSNSNITDTAIIALADRCEYLEHIGCYVGDQPSKVSATGYQLVEKIKTRPKPPPLEEGWWMDDGLGPQCKGMMN